MLSDDLRALDDDYRRRMRERRRAEMRQIVLLSVALFILVVHAVILASIWNTRLCVYTPATHTLTCAASSFPY